MTDDLFRQEALDHRDKSLYGEVILTPAPRTWLVTLILLVVLAVLFGMLFFVKVNTPEGPVTILKWFIARS